MNQMQEKKENKVIQFEKTIGDSVQNRITELTTSGRLDLPANYSVGNALNSAWLIISQTKNKDGQTALEVCTKESVANSLLDMAIMGLNPAKKQGYFIMYGKQLSWFTSYFGKCAALKRIKGIENEPIATIIYEGDELTLEHNKLGEEIVTNHKTSWTNKTKGKKVGAYATVVCKKIVRSSVMTIEEIKESWTKNPSPSNKRDHVDFEGEFMKRTVINRLVKMILQTSNDDDLLAETFIQNEDQHYDFDNSKKIEAEIIEEINNKANKGEIVGQIETKEKENTLINQQNKNEESSVSDNSPY